MSTEIIFATIEYMRNFTQAELNQYKGTDGTKSYIAYKGKVYDVSSSFLWKGGKHQALHHAGEDLTEALREAPHEEDLLERVPVIGELKNIEQE